MVVVASTPALLLRNKPDIDELRNETRVMGRIDLFNNGDWELLWIKLDDHIRATSEIHALAVLQAQSEIDAPPSAEDEEYEKLSRRKRVHFKCSLNQLGDGVRGLFKTKIAPKNEAALTELSKKFYQPRGEVFDTDALREYLQEIADPTQTVTGLLDFDTFVETLKDAKKGMAPDRFGWRSEHFFPLLGNASVTLMLT